jgi:hypothetical protein
MLAALIGGWQAQGQNITNAIPAGFDFESYTPGTNTILGTNGWYGGEETLAIVTNLDYTASKPAVNYPLDSSAHANVMQFDGEVTNPFTGGIVGDVYVDVMALPGRREETPSSNLVAGAQVAVFVNSNGALTIFRGIDTNQLFDGPEALGWLEMTNAPIGTSDWVRLTIHMSYNQVDLEWYQVYMNGALLSHPEGYASPDDLTVTNGTWFLTASQSGYFQELGLSGSGFLDDLVVTNGLPNMQPMLAIAASGNAGGSVVPSGVVYLVPGNSTNFTITASNYYYIADIRTNGATIGGTPPYSSPYIYTWNSTAGSGTLTALFSPSLTANGTPHWWLALYGLETNDTANGSLKDDGDGMPANLEYFAGTDPTNGGSVLEFEFIGVVNGTNVVKWQSALGPEGYAKYGVEYSTNLMANWIWATNVVRNPPTNTWIQPVTDTKLYYRITVTN